MQQFFIQQILTSAAFYDYSNPFGCKTHKKMGDLLGHVPRKESQTKEENK